MKKRMICSVLTTSFLMSLLVLPVHAATRSLAQPQNAETTPTEKTRLLPL